MQLNCFPYPTKITAKCRSLCFTGIPVFFASSFWAKLTRKLSRSELFPPRPAWKGNPSTAPCPHPARGFRPIQMHCARPNSSMAKPFQSPTNHTTRTCATLLMSAGHSPPPRARLVPCGHAPRIENTGTGPRTCTTLLMSAGHSPPPRARLVPCGHAPRNARRAGIAPRPPCLKKEIYEKETCTHISWHWTGCSGRCSPREPGQFAGFGRCCSGTPSRSRCRRASCRQYRWRWCQSWSPGCRQWR